MGSEDSKPNQKSDIFFDSLLNNSYNSSNYNNINSSISEENSNSNNIFNKLLIEKKNKNEKNNNNKLSVTFEWDNGGNSVYLSGSFCNWNQLFIMKNMKI